MKKSILSLSATIILLTSCNSGISFEDAAKWVETHYIGDQQVTVHKISWEWDFSMANGTAAYLFASQIIKKTIGYQIRTIDDLKKSFEIEDTFISDKLTVTNFRNKYNPSMEKDAKYTFKTEQDCLSVIVENNQNLDGNFFTIIIGDYYDKNGFLSYSEIKLPKCTFPDGSNCNNAFMKRTALN